MDRLRSDAKMLLLAAALCTGVLLGAVGVCIFAMLMVDDDV